MVTPSVIVATPMPETLRNTSIPQPAKPTPVIERSTTDGHVQIEIPHTVTPLEAC